MAPGNDSENSNKEKNYKNVGKLTLLSLIISLGWGGMGYSYAIYNPTIRHISYTLGWQKNEIPLRQALGFAMLPLSALISLAIVNWKFYNSSRRFLLITADLLTILGSLITTIPTFSLFLLGRAFLGLGIGINGPIASSFIRETTPVGISGYLTSNITNVSSVFDVVAFSLAFILPFPPTANGYSWRALYLVPALISVVRVIYLVFIYRLDTPKYYLLHDKESEAGKVLERTYPKENIHQAIKSVQAESEKEKEISFKTLLKDYRMQMIVSFIIVTFAQLTGQQTITTYSTSILTGASVDSDLDESKNREINIVNFIMALVSAIICISVSPHLDTQGRKKILLIGIIMDAISLITLAAALQFGISLLADIMVVVFAIGMGIGLGQMRLIYCAEVLPIKGFSLMLLVDNFLNLIFNFAFPLLASIPQFSFFGIVYVMGAIAVVGAIVVNKLVIETKGSSTNEIFERFDDINQKLIDDESQQVEAN